MIIVTKLWKKSFSNMLDLIAKIDTFPQNINGNHWLWGFGLAKIEVGSPTCLGLVCYTSWVKQ